MTRSKLFLLIVASCSVLFIGLVALAAYAWSRSAAAPAVLCSLLAFVCVLGQFASLALFLRERARENFLRQNRPDTGSLNAADQQNTEKTP